MLVAMIHKPQPWLIPKPLSEKGRQRGRVGEEEKGR